MLKTKPAKRPATCHPNRPARVRDICGACYHKWLMSVNPEFAERQRKNCREWSLRNQARIKETAKQRRWKETKEYKRARCLREYGLTLDDYDRMLTGQGGGCAICGRPPKEGKSLSVDHCHETGAVRGLLCFRCNFGLSYFAESGERMAIAADYLKRERASA
jgi:hypothetical protein